MNDIDAVMLSCCVTILLILSPFALVWWVTGGSAKTARASEDAYRELRFLPAEKQAERRLIHEARQRKAAYMKREGKKAMRYWSDQ